MSPVLAMVAAAASEAGSPDVVAQFLGYGVTGAVVVAIICRVLVPYWVVTRADAARAAEIAAMEKVIAAQTAEIAALRTGLDASHVFVRDEVVPALTRTAEINREYVAALNRSARAGAS